VKQNSGPFKKNDEEYEEEIEIIYMDEDSLEELADELGIYYDDDFDN